RGGAGRRGDVAGGVGGHHLVVAGGAGGQAAVHIGERRGGGDQAERPGRAGRSPHLVAGHAHVVRGRAPDEGDLPLPSGGGQVGGRGGRLGVRARVAHGDRDVRGHPHVAGGVMRLGAQGVSAVGHPGGV